MKRNRFFQTSVARIAALFTAAFVLGSVLLLAAVYLAASRIIDRDIETLIVEEGNELSQQFARLDRAAFTGLVRLRVAEFGARDGVYAFTGPDQRMLAGNLSEWPPTARRAGWIEFEMRPERSHDRDPHAVRARVYELGHGYRLLVGHDVAEKRALKSVIGASLMWSVGGMLLFACAAGWWLGRRMVKQLERVVDAVHRIRAGDLSRRLPSHGPGGEIEQLATEFNSLLERVEQLTLAMRAVLDSTAHDLRGPLSRLRQTVERAGNAALDDGERRALLESALAETDRLQTMLDSLLRIALAESGNVPMTPIDLTAMAGNVADLYEPVAEEKGLSLSRNLQPVAAVTGNRQLLAQALANLIDNAIKFSPRGASIGVELASSETGVRLTVADRGPGIPAGDQTRVLERGVRLENAHDIPGSGLGLTLVAAVARLHSAAIDLADNEPGLKVTVSFPAAAV
ncbi:MAG: HAMP domain-containing sensor histidine kinase [Steroidobacterales bacterium]